MNLGSKIVHFLGDVPVCDDYHNIWNVGSLPVISVEGLRPCLPQGPGGVRIPSFVVRVPDCVQIIVFGGERVEIESC